MMPMKTKSMGMGLGLPPTPNTAAAAGRRGAGDVDGDWEMRPGGMLVQKRTSSDQNLPPPPTIRVRVKHGAVYHELNISSQATFGELKKMLTGATGLHHEDQKLIFKKKERDSKAFLDTTGVKNKSKIVLMEDPISLEKRHIEMRKTAKVEKAAKSISEISLEVDRLAGQVSELESVISRGEKVEEKDVVNLIELLMNQLLKLDGIIEDVDVKVKMQRKMQVTRVQKCVETLDMLKIKISTPENNASANVAGPKIRSPIPSQQHQSSPIQQGHKILKENVPSPVGKQQARHPFGVQKQPQQHLQQLSRHPASGPVVITTQWETFDSMPAPVALPTVPPTSTTSTSTAMASAQPIFTWDLI
ncbi:BAG family molecular chaperone regulator 2-like [Coffea arabica]|uniref:BAG family molecular chaperone regulator 2-like n=1 Tax=Coffea arabica TaxID=13443 RepID=A0A6P6UTW6_COFAR|nr:BAG family molecular chaperone regulator 2-like [Coffea arabica]